VAVSVVNAWKGNFAQPSSFGTMPSALQSINVPLTVANSVGGGTGIPTAGNWLACITGLNEPAVTAGFTAGVSDDIHSFWRPGNVTTSQWAVSQANALSRTAIWYTANTQRAAGTVYVAPNGALDAQTALVIEISGLGPWDVITGIATAYAATATSLSLSLPAPSAASAVVGAVCGDTTAVTQTFAPAGWTTLPAVSASNGTDHTCDSVLSSAYLPSTTSSVSVSASASGASDLSGVLIAFQTSAPSPAAAGANPVWPCRTILEAGFGSGLNTPLDQITWTTLSDNTWTTPAQGWKRYWAHGDRSGIPYGLGQLQSSSGTVKLDNFDGALSPWNVASPWYSNALNQNPCFQFAVAPWTITHGTLALSSAHVFASALAGRPASSLQLTPDGLGTPAILSEFVPVTATGTYTVSAWLYSQGGWPSGAQTGIWWYDSTHTFISFAPGSPVTALPAATWTQVVDAGVTAPSNAAYGLVEVQVSGTPPVSGPFWIAEAAVVPGSTPVMTGRVTSGVPVRVRYALSTIKGTTYNRWHTWMRYAVAWPETRNRTLRNLVEVTTTDVWSAASGSCPSPYRGEVRQDNPQSDWPLDDQPLSGGVQPTTFRNAAMGNTNTMAVQSGGGVGLQNAYSTSGTVLTSASLTSTPPPAVAIYQAGAQQGWMYGDPQSSATSYATGNPVTASPGSAAWQQTGLLGNSGTNSWFLTANDSNFPPLSGGATVGFWFSATFFGSATGYTVSTQKYDVATQPVSAITLATLATASAPVALLQLDTSGHLSIITYNGSTPTPTSIYSSSDLRSGSWTHIMLTLTTTAWSVFVNGGLTASVSGTATGMTSSWNWLALNADFGTAGGSSLSSNQHGGNVAYSHVQVYAGRLPAWRILGHYSAAITGCGLLPAPQTVSISSVNNEFAGQGYVPDGSIFDGNYGFTGTTLVTYSFSALAVAQAGSYTSGPSARSTTARCGQLQGSAKVGDGVWVSWTSLAPSTAVYTSASAGTETQAAVCCGSGDSFSGGYGSGATGAGVCQVSGGGGGAFPAAPSPLGDTVAQRIERILAYAGITVPVRAIDATANLLVQAALDVGGQQAGASVQNIVSSDTGFMGVDTNGTLFYRSRTHLSSDTPVWAIGMNTAGGQAAFAGDITPTHDPQRCYNDIHITPYDPSGATLALVTPSSAAAVTASQLQNGIRPFAVTSYLQSTVEMLTMANWLIAQYGTPTRRIGKIVIDAAAQPAAWGLIAGVQPGDLCTVYDAPLGIPAGTGTYRISQVTRTVAYGADGTQPAASVELVLDGVPTSYWS
jgi:hypothetical protein